VNNLPKVIGQGLKMPDDNMPSELLSFPYIAVFCDVVDNFS